MDIKGLKIGNIVSVSLTYGATTVENQEFVEVEFDVVEIIDINPHKSLIKISYSPKVWVLADAIQGIPINDLVLSRLGWTPISPTSVKVPKPIIPTIAKAFERDSIQIYSTTDGKYHRAVSQSATPRLVEYVHDLQQQGANGLDPLQLLDK